MLLHIEIPVDKFDNETEINEKSCCYVYLFRHTSVQHDFHII